MKQVLNYSRVFEKYRLHAIRLGYFIILSIITTFQIEYVQAQLPLSISNINSLRNSEYIEFTNKLEKASPDSAIWIFKSLLKQISMQSSDTLRVFLFERIAGVYYGLNVLDSAYYYYRLAQVQYKLANNTRGYANTLHKLGIMHLLKGESPEAQVYFEEAARLFTKLSDDKRLSAVFNNLANSYLKQGNYNKAVQLYLKALDIDKKIGDEIGQAITFSNLGIIYFELTDNEMAIKYSKMAVSIYKVLKKEKEQANVFDLMGTSYLHLKQLDSAYVYYSESYKIANQFHDQALLALIENNLGEFYLQTKNYELAMHYFSLAFDKNMKTDDKYGQSLTLIGKGIVLSKNNRDTKAIELFKQAYQLSLEIRSPELSREAAKAMSESYEKTGNFKEAYKSHVVYKSMADSLLNRENIQKITSLQLGYEFDLKQRKAEFEQEQINLQHLLEMKQMRVRRITIVFGSISIIVLLFSIFLVYLSKQQRRIGHLKVEINKNMQRLLGQQMNPHFIFNTLKSIQSYILSNDVKQSNLFLNRFAGLIRKTLENSQSEFISLENEMEALTLYIQLEQLRLGNKFDFSIDIDDSINCSETMVPSLFFQPYVENAIWHGISAISQRGFIRIAIKKDTERIYCIIEDNGPGLSTKSIKNGNKSISLGTSITEKRIALLNKLYSAEISPNISEMKNGTNKITGTQVQFSIPLICS